MIITRIAISLLFYMFLGWLFCDIAPNKEYTWYSGIWHGLFFICNLVRSWFSDAIYKAEYYTTAYNVFYWIFSILTIIKFIFSGSGRREY